MVEQKELYEPIKKWLESYAFRVLVTGGNEQPLVIPIGDILPTRVHMIPDIVGIKETENRAVIIEIETDLRKILEVIGKCMLWKMIATFVYVAYPLEKCKRFKVFEKLGLGLLGVSKGEAKEIVQIMPRDSTGLFKVMELHPLDFSREMELVRLVRGILETAK
jgi:hypothetical protein